MFERFSVIDCAPGGGPDNSRKPPRKDDFFNFFYHFINSLTLDKAENILKIGILELSRLRPDELTLLCLENGKIKPPQILVAGRTQPRRESAFPDDTPRRLYRTASKQLGEKSSERLTLYTSYRPETEERELLDCSLHFLANRYIEARNWQSLKEFSRKDGLTGLYNRHHFEETLARECERSARYQRPLSLIMIDLDHFKQINDTYGHQAGDQVLQECGQLLRSTLRGSDIPCRYGGEELAVILPETSLEEATRIARRLRRQLAQHQFSTTANKTFTVTASLGVAGGTGGDPGHLVSAADQAMYAAKEQGRNQVVIHAAKSLLSAI